MNIRKIIITSLTIFSLVGVGGWTGHSNGLRMHWGELPTTGPQLVAADDPSKKGKPTSPINLPVYRPPKGIGAPGGRVGGGSRGQEVLTLFALVPDHLGLTIQEQPTLYWYLSKKSPYPVVLTINDKNRVKPIVETILTTAPEAGIHSTPLQEIDIRLELEREYQWFVNLSVDPENPSKNIVAGGRIQRIQPREGLLRRLRDAKPEQQTAIYSEAGLWYDALASISDLCDSDQNARHYCVGRIELLKQVDLMEVAKAEENIS